LPAEEDFFGLFDDIAQVLNDAAVCLRELVSDYQNIEPQTRALREMEKRVDQSTADITRRLNTSFVTPIDREDIHLLASSLDDVLDYIEASADRMKLYGIDKPRSECIELATLLVEGTKHIQEGVSALSNYRDIDNVLKPCVEINHVEARADDVERRALARLFKEESKPLEVAKWMEIFDRLETATDRCEDVANVLESIVVKNA
jgi:predicted phosphate transport protein (TIGR00153 family)